MPVGDGIEWPIEHDAHDDVPAGADGLLGLAQLEEVLCLAERSSISHVHAAHADSQDVQPARWRVADGIVQPDRSGDVPEAAGRVTQGILRPGRQLALGGRRAGHAGRQVLRHRQRERGTRDQAGDRRGHDQPTRVTDRVAGGAHRGRV